MAKTLSQQQGARWEKYVRAECQALLEQGRADVSKNHESLPPFSRHVHAAIEAIRRCEYRVALSCLNDALNAFNTRQKSKPDFSGGLPTGLRVVFEVKATTSKTSWPLSNIADHQRDHLVRASNWGQASFVYLLDGELRKWVLPMPEVCRWLVDERSSIPFAELDESYQKQHGETWLDTWCRIQGVET